MKSVLRESGLPRAPLARGGLVSFRHDRAEVGLCSEHSLVGETWVGLGGEASFISSSVS